MNPGIDGHLGVLNEIELYYPVVGVFLVMALIGVAIVAVYEVRRARTAIASQTQALENRLRGLEDRLARHAPARYALAAYIVANRETDREIEDLRSELEAILSDWDRMEGIVDDVLRALDETERRIAEHASNQL